MNSRRVVRTGIRAAIGVVALAVGAVVVVSASAVPLPSLAETPAGRLVKPVALDQQRVCSGSLLRLAGDSGASATTVTAIGAANTVTGAGDSVTPTTGTLKGADGASSHPQSVTAKATDEKVPQVAGSQSQSVAETDLRGFAVAPCAEPTSSTWLVGGSTETGRTTLIDLVNPSDVNSTVDLNVFAENGAVDGPGLQGIVVAPRSQKLVPLSGFQTGLVSPVVHVTSRGGLIAASLQVGVVRTLEAGGADIVSASAAPSKVVTVPGIVIRDGAEVQAKTGQAGYADLKSILRTFVPGTTNAQVTVQLATANGTGTTFTATAEAGRVTDVSLDGLADGLYTATVRSSQPVVAGARTSSIAPDGGIDVAWTGGAPSLGTDTMFTVAPGQNIQLSLSNPTAKAITTTLAHVGGTGKSTSTTISVPANSLSVVRLQPGSVMTLTKASGLHGAVSYAGAGQIAAYALFGPTAAASPVTVYP
ncbi:hypothetical protein AX769_17980 [Frondihabitans sp. PAMC 28766]|uniref:DUF5719 family protein n=1 Tax=Frondihabitans sp. PAMC 28766 TaxID=1795630 RepID=UPI00078B244F|nr:DUF5719 family protein [Frondihabitans sp. PAMC 28766]AMM21690.1 hypothetical protein AX769_17980 [Frondihabitans sp. PAMC 28766]